MENTPEMNTKMYSPKYFRKEYEYNSLGMQIYHIIIKYEHQNKDKTHNTNAFMKFPQSTIGVDN